MYASYHTASGEGAVIEISRLRGRWFAIMLMALINLTNDRRRCIEAGKCQLVGAVMPIEKQYQNINSLCSARQAACLQPWRHMNIAEEIVSTHHFHHGVSASLFDTENHAESCREAPAYAPMPKWRSTKRTPSKREHHHAAVHALIWRNRRRFGRIMK